MVKCYKVSKMIQTNFLPFGQALRLWRVERGLTQQELARRAGVARPNLCAIERGRREVSLRMLRALAAALEVRPGVLADGLGPAMTGEADVRLTRAALERVAAGVARCTLLRDAGERTLAEAVRILVGHRSRALRGRWSRPRTSKRQIAAAWLSLESRYPREAIRSLLERVAEREQRR